MDVGGVWMCQYVFDRFRGRAPSFRQAPLPLLTPQATLIAAVPVCLLPTIHQTGRNYARAEAPAVSRTCSQFLAQRVTQGGPP